MPIKEASCGHSNEHVLHLLTYPVRRGARSESTSAKVALMRMKMKAEGQDSVPQVCTVPHLPLSDLLLCVYQRNAKLSVFFLLLLLLLLLLHTFHVGLVLQFYMQSERVYYEVQLPKEYGLPNKPMFFSKVRVVTDKQEVTLLTQYTQQEWAVGRVIDFVAEKFKLRNENNKQCTQVKTTTTNVQIVQFGPAGF